MDTKRIDKLKKVALKLPDIVLNDRQLCDFELIATGVFSPLKGYMVSSDYESVLDRMRLQDGSLWPVPVCLDISEIDSRRLEPGQSVAVRDPEGFLLAVMHVQDIWPIDKKKEAAAVFQTQDHRHPGVNHLFQKTGDHYIGGELEIVNLPLHFDFKQMRLSPKEVGLTCQKLGWKRVVGFITRNPLHRAQYEMTIKTMRQARANLLLLPITGVAKPDDFDHYVRVKCYRAVATHYPPDSWLINLLPLAMRMAGPREALLHMLIAKNLSCTHFIIGRDHASPDKNCTGDRFYIKDQARKLAETHSEEIGVKVVPFEEMVYLPFEDEFKPIDRVPGETQTISLSGSDFRERIRTGRRIPDWATFPEVIQELQKSYPPPNKQGFTVFLTGLSGAGKSTIAKILYSRFLEIGERPVTLLDGDIVRRNLSAELSFSKEHRDINVRRIGFVASEITKNRGIAICAPIAPYQTTRSEIRATIEAYGGFVEAHVSTPIEVCEKRDRKGMYAKARAGLIKGFTGVDDPYETPKSPEVEIDTTGISPDEAVQEILLYLGEKGFI